MGKLRFILVIIMLAGFNFANAAEFGLAATVNGKPITNYDVDARVKLLKQTESPNIPNIKEVALQALINEALQKSAAEEMGITVTDQEMSMAFSDLEQKNKVAPGQFETAMRAKGVEFDLLKSQVKSQIIWQKILGKTVRQKVNVTDSEVEEAAKKVAAQQQSGEVSLSEIVIAADEQGIENVNKVMQELKQGGSFEELAKKYSSGVTAQNGGLMGWVREDQLGEGLRAHIKDSAAGTLLGPIRGEESVRIIKINDRRILDLDVSKIDREKVREMVTIRKMEQEARKYMNDLRKQAFIEIK